jgi:GTPase SAR1 family protein
MQKPKEKHGGFADPVLLDKVDKLFASGVGDYVYLPQLVVVGDQSSGKSSVLEGLTRLPFPRDSGLCTRFATQITFRRAEAKSISVTIIPGSNASDEHVEAVQAWKKVDIKELSPDVFASIMKEVRSSLLS